MGVGCGRSPIDPAARRSFARSSAHWRTKQPTENRPMRTPIAAGIPIGIAFAAALVLAQPKQPPSSATAPGPDSQYRLGPDSLPQEGVPKGEIKGPFTL